MTTQRLSQTAICILPMECAMSKHIQPVLVKCWPTVCDASPTLNQNIGNNWCSFVTAMKGGTGRYVYVT